MTTVNSCRDDGGCCGNLNCTMGGKETGEFDIVAAVRLLTACFSILGAFSVIGSATYRKTVCNPKVHPIFVLSIVDALLSLLWISGAVVWLEGGTKQSDSRVGCFTITLMTVILQCVAMNVTLIYALLVYSSIKQKDNRGVYVVQQGPVLRVWRPLYLFLAYFAAWTLPIALVMIPFVVISETYQLVLKANECSCWCLPYYGNIIPRGQLGLHENEKKANDYLIHLHYFITSFAVVLITNFAVVFCFMAVIYCRVFYQIRLMIRNRDSEYAPLFGAIPAAVVEGQKRARRRVLIFFAIYVITGITTFGFGVDNIVVSTMEMHSHTFSEEGTKRRVYALLLVEAILAPLQGFMNAIAYAWTCGDFLSAVSSKRTKRSHSASFQTDWRAVESVEEETEEQEVTDEEEEEWLLSQNSQLLSSHHI